MNDEKNKGMDVILTNLKNWQNNKKNTALMNELLINANSFEICYPLSEDNSEFFHLYPALEIIENENEKNFNLIIYMISENRDAKDFIEENINEADQFIKKFLVSSTFSNLSYNANPITQPTEISIEEAQLRISRWGSEITNWLDQNDIFEVFELPSEDFNFDSNITLVGRFGIKELEQTDNLDTETSTFVPDIMIFQTNAETENLSVFDMARLSPPWRKRELKFELLNKAL